MPHLDPIAELPHPLLAQFVPSKRACGRCRYFTPPSEARAELEAVSPVFRQVMQVLPPAEVNLAATPEGAQFPAEIQPVPAEGEAFKPVAARKPPNPSWNNWSAFGICRHPDHPQGRWLGDKCADWEASKNTTRVVYGIYVMLAVAVGSGAWWYFHV